MEVTEPNLREAKANDRHIWPDAAQRPRLGGRHWVPVMRWQGCHSLLGGLHEHKSSSVDGPSSAAYPMTWVAFSSLVTQFVDDPVHVHRGLDQEKQGALGLYGFASQFQQLEEHSVGLTGWFTC